MGNINLEICHFQLSPPHSATSSNTTFQLIFQACGPLPQQMFKLSQFPLTTGPSVPHSPPSSPSPSPTSEVMIIGSSGQSRLIPSKLSLLISSGLSISVHSGLLVNQLNSQTSFAKPTSQMQPISVPQLLPTRSGHQLTNLPPLLETPTV